MIQLKRAYDPVEEEDGCRVLVDRLWPRGISKQELNHDYWLKELAPSDKLRKWFDHDPKKFEKFRNRYQGELKGNDQVEELLSLCKQHQKVTLLFAAKDRVHNNAIVLRELLNKKIE